MSRRFRHVWRRSRRGVACTAAMMVVAAGCSEADRALMTAPTCTDATAQPSPVTHRPGQVVLMGSLIRSTLPPGPIAGWDDVVSVVQAATTAAAVHSDGTVSVVGVNHQGSLGLGLDAPAEILVPQQVPGISDAISVHASGSTILVVRRDGTVAAWGEGFIADGGTRDQDDLYRIQNTPQQVPGVESIVDIADGALNVLALRSDGRVTGWGINLVDSLGEPNGTAVRTLSDPPGAVDLTNAGDAAVIATGTGEVCAWGNNVHGLLGIEPTGGQTTTPVKVAGLERITAVAGGNDFALALDEDGAVWAWGRNASGVLGDVPETTLVLGTPVRIDGLPPIVRIGANDFGAHAIDADGTMWAWGSYMNIAALIDRTLTEPTRVPLPGRVQMSSGSLALLDGTAFGRAGGSLGTG